MLEIVPARILIGLIVPGSLFELLLNPLCCLVEVDVLPDSKLV
jgi:hypothetical protein